MFFRDGAGRAADPMAEIESGPHHPAKAKNVIWIFLCGGVSHLESWGPKPALNKYNGKSIADTPFAGAVKAERKDVAEGNPRHGNRKTLMGLNGGTARYGKSRLLAADWWKHTAEMADDLAVVRTVWTTDNDHGATLQFHTGRHVREGAYPTIGSWACYGLGALTGDRPEYVVRAFRRATAAGANGRTGPRTSARNTPAFGSTSKAPRSRSANCRWGRRRKNRPTSSGSSVN